MLGHLPSRFATATRFAPTDRLPTWVQWLVGGGLIVAGIWLGQRLVRRWPHGLDSMPRRSSPVQEIDRWANEGGAVTTPAFPKPSA